MNRFTYLLLLGALSLPSQVTLAQEKTQEKAKTEERVKQNIPVKVQIVVSEYDGEKKVSSMPYSFISVAAAKNDRRYDESLRTGVRIPIEIGMDGKDQKTYIDMGSNIDCDISTADDDRYLVHVFFERSTLYPGASAQDEKVQVLNNAQPLIRQFKSSVYIILRDGQTSESVVSTDPLNGHTFRMSVAINVLK